MRVWIDVSNSPQVPFFRPLIALLEERGHDVSVTTRDYAQTLELLRLHGIPHEVVGPRHGGASAWGKARAMAGRLPRPPPLREASRLRHCALTRVARAPARGAVARDSLDLRVRLRVRARPARARLARGAARRRSGRDPAGAARPSRSTRAQGAALPWPGGGVLPRRLRAGRRGPRRARPRPRAGPRRRAHAARGLALPPPRQPALPRRAAPARSRSSRAGGRASPDGRAASDDRSALPPVARPPRARDRRTEPRRAR